MVKFEGKAWPSPFFTLKHLLMLKKAFAIMMMGVLLSCSTEDDGTVQITRPTGLRADIEVSTQTEGLVEVSLSAFNANFYRVSFVDTDETVTIESTDGTANYTFGESGTYAIISRAYASYEYYAERIDSVTVTVSSGSGSGGGIPTTGYSTPLSYPDYTLVWNDEFEGSSLSSDWTHEIGTGNNGWGNNELQYYRPENTEVRDGYLIITAKNEVFGGRNYTSSRIITQGQESFKYGRIDIRAAMPEGQGLWPALWMLGDNFNTVGWPACGEIDIMEMVGGTGTNRGDKVTHGTAHWQDPAANNALNHAQFGTHKTNPSGRNLSEDFHVYSIVWDANNIKWYFDDVQYHQLAISATSLSEFRENFFFILNVAVGGNWPGPPNSSTVFPQQMVVDYVRVFQ